MPSAATAPTLAAPDDGSATSGGAGGRARPGPLAEPMRSLQPSRPRSRFGAWQRGQRNKQRRADGRRTGGRGGRTSRRPQDWGAARPWAGSHRSRLSTWAGGAQCSRWDYETSQSSLRAGSHSRLGPCSNPHVRWDARPGVVDCRGDIVRRFQRGARARGTKPWTWCQRSTGPRAGVGEAPRGKGPRGLSRSQRIPSVLRRYRPPLRHTTSQTGHNGSENKLRLSVQDSKARQHIGPPWSRARDILRAWVWGRFRTTPALAYHNVESDHTCPVAHGESYQKHTMTSDGRLPCHPEKGCGMMRHTSGDQEGRQAGRRLSPETTLRDPCCSPNPVHNSSMSFQIYMPVPRDDAAQSTLQDHNRSASLDCPNLVLTEIGQFRAKFGRRRAILIRSRAKSD